MAGKPISVVALLLCLTACEQRPSVKSPEWSSAPREYVCTEEQMRRVESEAAFCNENTSYFSEYCYGAAFIRNCTKRATQPLPPTNEE